MLTLLFAVAAYFINPIAAKGLVLGAIGGILGFWIIAVRIEKLATIDPDKVRFSALTWSTFRFALYAIVLVRAHFLDRETHHGLLGALIGVFIIRIVLMYMGLTGVDLAKSNPSNEED